MLEFLRKIFVKNMGLKIISLVLALALWFYIVNELNKGSDEERQLLNRVLPREGMAAKKLPIKPIFIGKAHYGYAIDSQKVLVMPEYCIVVGPKNFLEKIRFAYTMPIDINGIAKTFIKSIPLNPIAPGIYTE